MGLSTTYCFAEQNRDGSHHLCKRTRGHDGPHRCPCGHQWAPQRTYVVSAASVEWRSRRPLIKDEMPQLGEVKEITGGGRMRTMTLEEALEDADNEILWLEQELEEHRRYRAALDTPVTRSEPKEG